MSGATFADISGATSTTYSFSTALGDSGKQYRALFTNSVGTATTTAATLTVPETPSLIVTTISDSSTNTDGLTSLREALAYAATLSGPQTITYSNSTANGAVNFFDGSARTITLNGTELAINSSVTITGPGANVLTVSGNNASRVFSIGTGNYSVMLTGLTIINGNAGGGVDGGGIYNASTGTVTLTNCALSGNSARIGGGIFNASTGALTLTSCTFSGNTVTGGGGTGGGGIWNNDTGAVTLANCTLSGNSADLGGGIAAVGAGAVTLTNCTVSGNSASSGAAGIYANNAVTLRNTICVDTTFGTITNGGNNIIGGTVAQAGLGALANNGGPTKTIALLPGSPAINAGGALSLTAVQSVTVSGASGTFTLTYNGQPTGALAFNATASQVQSALNALSSIGGAGGSVAVTLSGNVYTVVFGGTLSGNTLALTSIGAGGATAVVANGTAYPTDQRGIARVGVADIGAFEARAFTLALSSGDNQSRTVGTAFGSPLVVTVTGTGGDPVNGGTITFTAPGSGASLNSVTGAATVTGGTASYTATANTIAGGPYTVAATAAGASPTVNYSLTNTPAASSQVVFGTQPTDAVAGVAVSPAVTVRILDSFGNVTTGTAMVTVAIGTNPGNGMLSGTQSVFAMAGVATFSNLSINKTGTGYTLTAASGGLTGATSNSFNITPAAASQFAVTAPTPATAGNPFSITVTALDQFSNVATGYVGAVTFTKSDSGTGSAVPSNYTFVAGDNGVRVFTNGVTFVTTPSQSVTATDKVNALISGRTTVAVNPAISFGALSVTAWTVNSNSYTATIAISGGSTPYGNLTQSGLPTGLMAALSGSTITISGTPTQPGTFSNVSIGITDAANAVVSNTYSLTINPAVAVTPATLPGGTVYVAYNQTVVTTGGTGTTTFAVTAGTLPTGLSLNTGTGAITGTPTVDGPTFFAITATDGVGATGATSYFVTILPPNLTLSAGTGGTLPPEIAGTPFNIQLTGGAGLAPYTFAITMGVLPTGVTLSPGGLLSGTPTQAGTFPIVVTITDSTPPFNGNGSVPNGVKTFDKNSIGGPYTGSQNYTLIVGAPKIVVDVSNLSNGRTDSPYTGKVTAKGGVGPYTFAVTQGSLPAGLTIDKFGNVTGTPTLEVNAAFTVTATDSTTGTGPFTGSSPAAINIDRKPVFISGPNADANASVAGLVGSFKATTDVPGAIITWNFGDGSPPVTGAPVNHLYGATGTYTVTVTATNPVSGSSQTVTLSVTVSDVNAVPGTFGVRVTSGRMKLGGNPDSISFLATLHYPASGDKTALPLTMTLGGISQTFNFDASGNASNGSNGKAKLSIRTVGGVIREQEAKVQIVVSGTGFKSLIGKGVALDANGLPKKVQIDFGFNGKTLSFIGGITFKSTGALTSGTFGFKN